MLRLLLGLLLCCFAWGCSGNSDYPATAPVKGVLLYEGKPLANASISLIPDSGRPASGTTNVDGKFELMTFAPGDGAIPGEHRVLVQKYAQPSGDLYSATKSEIPMRYSEIKSTPLRQKVLAKDNPELRIELED
ncbi:hypothetical protein [Bremerella alba]|uniref:Carboxypeptidase regulatory-like domain-containing protein n=1 Tax=Bremerella alba TaxID=980252 RepID=A0A7V9A9T7_9BACT|nr:hypothetical protein [Bremerella alba]MBA2117683.1 hypothetical protein [Bremerella alba]